MRLSQRISIAALALLLVAGSLVTTASGSRRQPGPPVPRSPLGSQPPAEHRQFLPMVLVPSLFQNIADSDKVAQTVTIIGTYPLTVTNDLWIFVLPQNQRYYPQSLNACAGERTPKVNGKWEMRVGLGGPANVDESFEILLTSATAPASQYILDTLRGWCAAQNYPGFEALPAGISILQQITITRTADLWGPPPQISSSQLLGIVTITSPIDQAEVNQEEIVRGTYTSDAVNDIWLLIFPPNGRWYPQSHDACNGDHTHKANGLWDARVTFGGPENVGQPFDVVVVLADASASREFDAKQREWCANSNYLGWLTIELPQQITEQQRIRVIRK